MLQVMVRSVHIRCQNRLHVCFASRPPHHRNSETHMTKHFRPTLYLSFLTRHTPQYAVVGWLYGTITYPLYSVVYTYNGESANWLRLRKHVNFK